MGQLPFVSEGTRYLDGFLAAARPGDGRAAIKAPPPSDEELPAKERIKRRLHPLDSFPRLLECVAANRPPTPDDQFRFEWFGLFYQAPRQDAFRVRLRLPGGRVQAFQLTALAEITQECAAGEVILNVRGGLDIPGVPLAMAAEILGRIEGIGLSARQTGGDCVQSVRGGECNEPVYSLVCRLEQALAHSRLLADLPGACEVIFLAADEPLPVDQDHPANGVVLRATATEPDGEARFLLAVPGGPEGGWRLPASQVVPGCLKLLEAWAAGADRSGRQDAGLASYCRAAGRERADALFTGAGWQAVACLPTVGSAGSATVAAPGLLVPGGRLLSGSLRRVGEILREQSPSFLHVVRGSLGLAPGADAQVRTAVSAAFHLW